jgi:hypothetical protein
MLGLLALIRVVDGRRQPIGGSAPTLDEWAKAFGVERIS